MFDEVTYHRNVGRNVLTVRKKLVSEPVTHRSRPEKTEVGTLDVSKQWPPFAQDRMGAGTQVESRRSGTVVIVTPRDRFDTNSALEVERMLMNHIERGERRIVLDLSHIAYISSIGLRVILKAVTAMTGRGGRIVLSGGNEQVHTVLQFSGALIMNLHAATLEAALSKVQEPG
jgi:anti-sigma B factor antagonist